MRKVSAPPGFPTHFHGKKVRAYKGRWCSNCALSRTGRGRCRTCLDISSPIEPVAANWVSPDGGGEAESSGVRAGLLLFAWYDFYVGMYWNKYARKLYVLPVPCFGFWIEFGKKEKMNER